MKDTGFHTTRKVRLPRGTGGFLLALLVLRGLFLLAAIDPEEDRIMNVFDCAGLSWTSGPERPLYDREELYAGAAADAIRHGAGIPLWACRFEPYGSGSLLIALAAVPLFALFGPTLLAFKLIPLAVTIAGGLFWFLAVRAWTGESVARRFALLYLLAPPLLVRTALIAKGDHAEAMALVGAVMFLASRAAREPAKGRLAGLAGLVAGLSVYVTYSTLPIILGVGLVGLARARAWPRRPWSLAAAGFGIGLIPWLLTLVQTAGGALRIYGRAPGSGVGLSQAATRATLLFNRGFQAGFDLPGGSGIRTLAGLIFLAAVLVGWGVLIRRARSIFPSLVLAGTAAHLAAFCLIAPDAASRYLVPVYPLLLLAVLAPSVRSGRLAISTSSPVGRSDVAGPVSSPPPARGSEPSGPISTPPPTGGRDASNPVPENTATRDGSSVSSRRLRQAGLALVLLLGAFSQGRVILGSRFPALRAPLNGTDWSVFGEVAGQKLSPAMIRNLPALMRPFAWKGRGIRIYREEPASSWPALAAEAEADSGRVWEGIGISWAEAGRVPEAGPFLAQLNGARRIALRDGLVEYGEVFLAPMAVYGGESALRSLFDRFAPEDRPALARCLARTAGILEVHGAATAGVVQARARLDPIERAAGLGWARYCCGYRGRIRMWPDPGRNSDRLAAAGQAGPEHASEAAGAPGSGNGRGTVIAPGNGSEREAAVVAGGDAASGEAPDPGEVSAFWDGLAAAHECELGSRAPIWILGRDGDLRNLAGDLDRITRGLAPSAAARFYRRGGRAAARALRQPFVAGAGGAGAAPSWDARWRGLIPPQFQSEFESGLTDQGS